MLVYGKMLGMTGSLFIQGCVNRNTKLKNVAMKGHCSSKKKKKNRILKKQKNILSKKMVNMRNKFKENICFDFFT